MFSLLSRSQLKRLMFVFVLVLGICANGIPHGVAAPAAFTGKEKKALKEANSVLDSFEVAVYKFEDKKAGEETGGEKFIVLVQVPNRDLNRFELANLRGIISEFKNLGIQTGGIPKAVSEAIVQKAKPSKVWNLDSDKKAGYYRSKTAKYCIRIARYFEGALTSAALYAGGSIAVENYCQEQDYYTYRDTGGIAVSVIAGFELVHWYFGDWFYFTSKEVTKAVYDSVAAKLNGKNQVFSFCRSSDFSAIRGCKRF